MPARTRPIVLFVYGTLRPATRHPRARQLLREARPIGRVRAPGARLFRVRDYPGLVAGGGRGVTGDLLRLRRPAHSLHWLDAYEGTPHPYARGAIPVLHRGRRLIVTGYAWTAPLAGLRLIGSGDWLRR